MLPTACVEHQIPGRMRLRIPQKRGDVAFFERAVQTLSKLSAVTEIDASPLAGSLRIRHTGTSDPIIVAAAQAELFELGRPEAGSDPKQPRTRRHSEVGTLETIATGLSGLALFQVARGQITGSAAENFWNAYGAQRVLGNQVVAAGFGLLGLYQLLQGQWLGSASSLFFYALMARQLAEYDRAASAMQARFPEAPSPSNQADKPAQEPPKREKKRRDSNKRAEKTRVSH